MRILVIEVDDGNGRDGLIAATTEPLDAIVQFVLERTAAFAPLSSGVKVSNVGDNRLALEQQGQVNVAQFCLLSSQSRRH